MRIFIDISAIYALLDRNDIEHKKAKKIWIDLLHSENILITSNYVLVESFALLQNRLGLEAARGFQEDIIPLVNIEWVNAETHKSGLSGLLSATRRKLSLVDCVSFEIMRTLGIKTVFAFDPHFAEQDFQCIP
jgi:uncharacterized protein